MKLNDLKLVPTSGVIQLVVRSRRSGECRTFAAEASWPAEIPAADGPVWMVTAGRVGWTRLHHGWTPIGWLPLTPFTGAIE